MSCRFNSKPYALYPGNPDLTARQRQRVGRRHGLLLAVVLSGPCGCHPTGTIPPSGARSSLQSAQQIPLEPTATGIRPAPNGPSPVPPSQSGSDAAPHVTPALVPARPKEIPEASWVDLSLPEFEPAVTWYRPHAPLFVVTHGAGGEAEWHCRRFHRIFSGRISLLCPRGKRRMAHDPSQGYYYPDHHALYREVHAAIDRFEASVPPATTTRPYAYAGYSQGATMGALAFAEEGHVFSRLLLVEGGYADWSNFLASRFRKSGGHTVLLVCGTKACNDEARTAASHLRHAQIRANTAWAPGAGHRPDGEVGDATVRNLPFLLEGDPRWAGFEPVPVD